MGAAAGCRRWAEAGVWGCSRIASWPLSSGVHRTDDQEAAGSSGLGHPVHPLRVPPGSPGCCRPVAGPSQALGTCSGPQLPGPLRAGGAFGGVSTREPCPLPAGSGVNQACVRGYLQATGGPGCPEEWPWFRAAAGAGGLPATFLWGGGTSLGILWARRPLTLARAALHRVTP